MHPSTNPAGILFSMSLHALKRSPMYLEVVRFLDSDEAQLVIPKAVSFNEREAAKRVAEHFDCKWRLSDGNELVISRPAVEEPEQLQELLQGNDQLLDRIVNLELCLGLTQKSLAQEQLKCHFLSVQTRNLHRLARDSRDPDAKRELGHAEESIANLGDSTDSPICSACERDKVTHSIFPCAHVFCRACAISMEEEKSCIICDATVEGSLGVQYDVSFQDDLVKEGSPNSKRLRS